MKAVHLIALAFAVGAALWSVEARADAIGPPPASCPEGSEALTCHGPETCAARTCETSDMCRPGEHCVDVPLCAREHCCSGRACGDPATPRFPHVVGPCGAGNTCTDASTTCQMLKVCVPIPEMDGGPTSMDGGGADDDAGGADEDSGASMDSGSSDSGGTTRDSGGATGGTAGGCCGVAGRTAPAGWAVLAVSSFLLTLLVRRRVR